MKVKRLDGPDVIHAAGVKVRGEGDPGQGGVATVGAAIDGDALGIGDPLFISHCHAVGDVVLHLAAPLFEAGLPEGLAVAGGTAEVHLQHRQAAVGQELDLGVEAPMVAGPGTAVRVDHHGQVLGRRSLGQGQIPMMVRPSRDWY